MTLCESAVLPDWLNVSRETHQRLCDLLDLVGKWNAAINLVASGTLADGWRRHILDSAQLFEFGKRQSGIWADLGSGAGFPGLVLAILAAEFILVESDCRKATFLLQASRSLNLKVQVICDRAERLAPVMADVLTARAFAPLEQLCGPVFAHLAPTGLAILPKGGRHGDEVRLAARSWRFDLQTVTSLTDPNGAILLLRNIRHV